MKYIDVSTWKRAMHCEVFRNSVQPQYSVTFDVDITNFLSGVKKRRFSFTFSFVYAVAKCANEIEELRCREHRHRTRAPHALCPSSKCPPCFSQ